MKKEFRILSVFALGAFIACSELSYPDRSTHVVDSAAVNQVLLWPSGLRYIAVNETVVVRLKGLQRGYACATVLESVLKSSISHDTAYVHPQSKVELPGNPFCALESQGLDTALRLPPLTTTGLSVLVLKTPGGTLTDTAQVVTAVVHAESLSYVPDTTGKLVKGKFVFRDSTAAHPSRTLKSDSLLRCETLQGAVFTRSSDTIKVRFHRLVLDSTKHATLTPCLANHGDSLNVVFDTFGFPKF